MIAGSDPQTNSADNSQAQTQGGGLLRVSADKVSRLMDLVGELSLSVSETVRSPDLDGLELSEFEKSAYRLKQIVREIQDAAAELRVVPVGDVFRRMRRMVRELERQTNKEIDLVFDGEETEIDKMVVDRLFEPLVHVVRNSADHGLEKPEDRVALGKLRKGRISLAAAQSGSDVRITIEDDGRGLNRERILKVARERGFVGPDEEPENSALWPVIFRPGFSTAETVSNLSGRGVGMDVLHTTMNAIRGRISIESEWGRGTRVILSIPLTLAFLDCLVMRIAERMYAMPIDAVAEIFRPEDEQLTTISASGGHEMVKVRNSFIPICRLSKFYGEPCESGHDSLDQSIIVVLHTSLGKIGVPVDEMYDQQQVVMKPLLGYLEGIRASYGCALLATGEVAIVLDCEELAKGVRR